MKKRFTKIRNIFFLLMLSTLISCNNNRQVSEVSSDNTSQQEETDILAVSELLNNAECLKDSLVVVKGIVEHICKHSDRRMKIIDSENELRIDLDKNLSGLEPSIIGKTVVVSGKLKTIKMNEAMVMAWKAKKIAGHAGEEKTEHFQEEIAETDSILNQLREGKIEYYLSSHIDAIEYVVE